ncbi:hypothetical protein HG530_002919 [Fusarium avenaceum]|nr:hypothetical protein HG530_002919 [Fusarium avenaceum]
MRWASGRGMPIATAPSMAASSTRAKKAGPEAHRAVEASMCRVGSEDLLDHPGLASQKNNLSLLNGTDVVVVDNLENGRVLPERALDALSTNRSSYAGNEA